MVCCMFYTTLTAASTEVLGPSELVLNTDKFAGGRSTLNQI